MAIRAVPNGDEYDKDIALGIRYAVDNGAKVINGSFGKYFSSNPEWVIDAIRYASENNVLVIAAAGNESKDLDSLSNDNYPNDQFFNKDEFSDTFIKVGASSINLNENFTAYFSNYGKINVDSNALYRQDLIKEMRDESQENILELEASKWGLNYVTLDGSVGCMVNGAGLAMGTMDIIKLAGGFPANFLDVGGAVNKESVTEAFKIIISDSKVKSILINVFGGIVRCDVVAEGIISAIKDVGIKIPVVVRLKGNNSEIAKSLLEKSKLNIFTELDLSKAAKKAVELSE